MQKFLSAIKYKECYNPSENLLVLVDEGHRSHGGENHQRMRKALPHAGYIAFTGTPLLKKTGKRRWILSAPSSTPTPCAAPSRMAP